MANRLRRTIIASLLKTAIGRVFVGAIVIFVAVIAVVLVFTWGPESDAIESPFVASVSGVAISGYDPVAYFTEGRPVQGVAEHAVIWRDARWQFMNAEHKRMFEQNPERFAPQFGGYCAAWIASSGERLRADPEVWTIVNNKLYLNFDAAMQHEFEANEGTNISRAERNWTALVQKEMQQTDDAGR